MAVGNNDVFTEVTCHAGRPDKYLLRYRIVSAGYNVVANVAEFEKNFFGRNPVLR